jgi:hypothetical protein
MDWIIGELIILAGPLYLFLQLLMGAKYRGRWLVLALVPLLVMVPVGAQSALAFAAGSNVWLMPLVLSAPLACLYLLALAVAKAIIT